MPAVSAHLLICAICCAQVTEANPILVAVGDSPAVAVAPGTDWPEGLHECPLPIAALPAEGEVAVKVKFQHVEATVTLKGVNVVYIRVCDGL